MARRDEVEVRKDTEEYDGARAEARTTPTGSAATRRVAGGAVWEALPESFRDDQAPRTALDHRGSSWEVTLLARWGRLHLLLAIIQPLLPPDHPRLRLVRQALFSTYQDLKAIGVEPRAIPAA